MFIINKKYKLSDYFEFLHKVHNIDWDESTDIIFDYWVVHYPEEEKHWRTQYSKRYHDYEMPYTDHLEKQIALIILQK